MNAATFTGTMPLVRFALRRDRVRLPVWILAITLTILLSAISLPSQYPDEQARQSRAALMSNPAVIAFTGPEIGVENYTYGAMMTNETLTLTAVAIAIMNILLVVRHTRAEEAEGRTELIRASVVGRYAPLGSALVIALVANFSLLLAMTIALGATGIESITWAGSLLYAASAASVGLVFAAVTAVTVQISEGSRAAGAMAGGVLGAAVAVRAAGDLSDGSLSWLSPIGWAHRTYAYVDDLWWPLILPLVMSAVLGAVGFSLIDRRDVGAGLRRARPGPAGATAGLIGPFRLAWRLQRGGMAWWALGLGLFGATYGSVIGDVESFASELATMEDMFENATGSVVNAFLALMVALLAMIAAIEGILASLRARSDETTGLAEAMLATGVSRERWLGSYLAMAAIGCVGSLLTGTLLLGGVGAIVSDDPALLGQVLRGALVYVVPLLFTIAMATFLFGLAPKAMVASWIVIAYGIFVLLLGSLLGVPQWMLTLSPFQTVPMLPAEHFSAVPLVILAVASILLAALGFKGFRRRDLATVA